MKKLLKTLLAILISITIIGCKPKEVTVENPDFTEFTDEVLKWYYQPDDPNILFSFGNPENFGLSLENPDFKISSLEDSAKTVSEAKEWQTKLKGFKYDSLTNQEKDTYDYLDYKFQSLIDSQEFYYHSNGELGSFIGTNCDLPYLFIAWPLINKERLDYMINFLEALPETFQNYIDYEFAKVENKLPKTKATYEGIVEQAQEVVKAGKNYFLIEQLAKRVDEVPNLTPTEVQDYKKQIKSLISNEFIEAYKLIADQIPALYDKAADENTAGLATFPKGKEYYAYLLKYKVGVLDSASDIKAYLNERLDQKLQLLIKIYRGHMDDIESGAMPLMFENNNFNDMIEYLKSQTKNDFPTIKDPEYSLEEIDKSLQDSFSPAAYFSPLSDIEYKNLVLVNPKNVRYDVLITMAHETYPGHLYQMNYVTQSDLPMIRKTGHVTGYIEGWGKYADHFSHKYAKETEDYLVEFFSIDNDFSYLMWCIIDIGVNDEGWSIDDVHNFMADFYGEGISREDAAYYYNVIQENPANMLQYYYTYYLIEDYKVDFKNTLKGKYTDLLFHQSVLETGPVPMFILKRHLEQIAKNNK